MASLQISTGLKVYDIEDENGNVRGKISFNPKDFNFFSRANTFQEKVSQCLTNVENMEDDMTEEDIIKLLDSYDKTLKEELNKLFDDENASKVVFGNQSCLNMLNGKSFVERFLEAFLPIITSEFAEMTKEQEEVTDSILKDMGIK